MLHRGRFVNNNMLVDDSSAARTIINMHGFIHSDLVARFDDNRFWSEDWKEDRVLRCIFTIK